MRGELYLIGTPIGNLSDLSERALKTMCQLSVLFCEDTRVTGKLLKLLGISVPLRALSDDHGPERIREAIHAINHGQRVGFVTDAGMPGVSDPGRRLVRAAWEAGITPVVIPGPSSVGTLLAACPFVDNSFCFLGFPPRKKNDRAAFVSQLVQLREPGFFFESPQRVHALLDALCASLEPERELLIGREMTKMHEQIVLLIAGEWTRQKAKIPEVGEYTVAVAARPPSAEPDFGRDELRSALDRLLAAGFSKRDAVKALAAAWEVQPNELKALLY
jgi:16S rRNA (cytidine1402-2'-O)-methyltransferase